MSNPSAKPRADVLGVAVVWIVVAILVAHATSWALSMASVGRMLGFSEKVCAKAPHLAIADILAWLAGAALAVRIIIERDWAILKRLSLPGALLAAWAAASALFAHNRLAAVAEVVQYAEYFVVLYLVFVTVLGNEGRLRSAVALWLAVGGIVVAWGLVDYLRDAVSPLAVSGPFLNRNVFGGYVAMLLPVGFGLALWSKSKLAWAQGAVLILAGLMAMLAGGPWLAAFIGLAVVAFIRSRWAFPILAAAVVALVVWATPSLQRDNPAILRQSVQVVDEGVQVEGAPVISPRYMQWQAAAKFLTPGSHRELAIPASVHTRQLILGVGVGNYQSNIGQFYGMLPKPNANTTEDDTGNLYVVLAVSAGLPAALLFLWLVGAHVRRAAAGFLATNDAWLKGLLAGCVGSLAAVIVANVFTETLVRGTGVATVLVLALAAAAAKIAERKVA